MWCVASSCKIKYEENFNNKSLKVEIYTKIDTIAQEKLKKQQEKRRRKEEVYESTKKAKNQQEKLLIKVF